MVKLLTNRVHGGRFTQQIKDQFTELTRKAMKDYVRERVNERLKSALDTDKSEPQDTPRAATQKNIEEEKIVENNGIETTEEELEGYRIIRAIGAELVDPERIAIRDAKSYCAILLDDNNRRPICRLHFGKKKMSITIFAPDNESRFDLEKVIHIYQHRALIQDAIGQYETNSDTDILSDILSGHPS